MTRNKNTIKIPTPDDFSFRATVYSHGWSELAPFALDEENWRLSYVFTDGKRTMPGVIFEEDGVLTVELAGKGIAEARIIRDVRHLLRLDDDLTDFYSSLATCERLHWVGRHRAGRLMRSPTVWEDLVKTICTTNCSWGLTKTMIGNLVGKLGLSAPPPSGGGKASAQNTGVGTKLAAAFPTAASMASMSEDFYRSEIKAGYRSPYFIELAEAVASGKLDPEAWLTSDLPTVELRKEMKKVKGVGDYAADNLLKLVGRYDGLALDSFLRSQFYKTHNKEKPCPDKKIERHYRKYGKWQGLAIWCDLTEDWINKLGTV